MPIYEYLCQTCEQKTEKYKSRRDDIETTICKTCGAVAHRVLSVPARPEAIDWGAPSPIHHPIKTDE